MISQITSLIKNTKLSNMERGLFPTRKGRQYWVLDLTKNEFYIQEYDSYEADYRYTHAVVASGMTFRRIKQIMGLCPEAYWILSRDNKICASSATFAATFEAKYIPVLKPDPKRDRRNYALAKQTGFHQSRNLTAMRSYRNTGSPDLLALRAKWHAEYLTSYAYIYQKQTFFAALRRRGFYNL